jgi:hypothetical protein
MSRTMQRAVIANTYFGGLVAGCSAVVSCAIREAARLDEVAMSVILS